MAITTGAATTDNLNWASGASCLRASTPGVALVWGWMKISTFTAGRCLSANLKLEGTAELRLIVTRLTTSAELTTTGAALVTNEWTFVCYAVIATTTAQDSRVWVGRTSDPPTKLALTTAVAGSGNFFANNISVLGNLTSAGTVAFQGSLDGWAGSSTTLVTTGADNPFGMSSLTALTADDEQFLYDRFVIPAWLGNTPTMLPRDATSVTGVLNLPVNAPFQEHSGIRKTSAAVHNTEASVVGTVASQERGPRATGNIDFPYLRR